MPRDLGRILATRDTEEDLVSYPNPTGYDISPSQYAIVDHVSKKHAM